MWVLVGVANSRQLGSSNRISAIDENAQLQESLSISQAREMALQQRVEEVEVEMREQERR